MFIPQEYRKKSHSSGLGITWTRTPIKRRFAMRRWEYKQELVEATVVQTMMSELGKEGWELVSTDWHFPQTKQEVLTVHSIFKRPLPSRLFESFKIFLICIAIGVGVIYIPEVFKWF